MKQIYFVRFYRGWELGFFGWALEFKFKRK
jgi:hypothetical protein